MEYPLVPIEYPGLRLKIQDALEELSSLDYQKHIWMDQLGPQKYSSYFELVWDCLMEDLDLSEDLDNNNAKAIGILFVTSKEAQAPSEVVRLLDSFTQDANFDWNNPLIYSHWSAIIEAAQKALKVFNQADRICFFSEQSDMQIAQAALKQKPGANFVLKRLKQAKIRNNPEFSK